MRLQRLDIDCHPKIFGLNYISNIFISLNCLLLWLLNTGVLHELRFEVRSNVVLFRLHRMHEMLTIVTDVRGVCLSVTRL